MTTEAKRPFTIMRRSDEANPYFEAIMSAEERESVRFLFDR